MHVHDHEAPALARALSGATPGLAEPAEPAEPAAPALAALGFLSAPVPVAAAAGTASVSAAASVATSEPLPAEPSRPRRIRALPDRWTHRTAKRVWHGPLEPVSRARTRGRGAAPQPADDGSNDGEDFLTTAHNTVQSPLQVLWVLTRTEFRARYRAQALGIIWSLLNPLVMMGILGVIFTHIFRSAEKHFQIFLLIGLIVWQWINGSITASTNALVNNADIIKRTVFARQLLPLAAILSLGLNFCIESLVLIGFIPIFPDAFCLSPALLLVPVLLVILVAMVAGVALMVSVLNVIYRDVAYLVTTGLLLLYWVTPVFYPLDVIPFPYRTFMQCNPIAGILTALRRSIMYGEYPSALGWAGMVVPTAILLIVGWRVFRHYEHMVLDYV